MMNTFYKCLDCGHIFEGGEVHMRSEFVCDRYGGEQTGAGGYIHYYECPNCGGESFEETTPCCICGSQHLAEEMINGEVCQECLDSYRKDFKMCYAISLNDAKQKVAINPLLAAFFDADDIEAILVDYILKKCPDADFSAYIDDDADWYAQELAREVTENDDTNF